MQRQSQRQSMRNANATPADSSDRSRWLRPAIAVTVGLVAAGWWFLQPSRTARIATRTIALQDQLLGTAVDSAARRTMLREIMHNVDQLRPDEIRRVREALFRRLNAMRVESLARFADAQPDERTALLDDDLERIRLARNVLDATEQGGMRPVTEAELAEREERRRKQEEARRNPPPKSPPKPAAPAATAAKPTRPPKPSSEEQELMKIYLESLTKRAKEKNVDLGRMFGRPPGRG